MSARRPAPGAVLALTTGVSGMDGLSRLSREVVSALSGSPDAPVEVWSLTDCVQSVAGLTGVDVMAAGGSRLRYGAWSVLEGLAPQRGRIVICLHAHLAPVALPLLWRGARLVHILVGIEVWKPLSRAERAAIRRAAPLVAISDYSRTMFLGSNPSFGEKEIVVCHPGIPAGEAFEPPAERPYALIVGRMSSQERYKGHDALLETWEEVRRRNPGLELVVAGSGDDRTRLERKASGLGLGASVRFAGSVSDRELETLYRECAFFVMPSAREGFGFVFLEAMRAGKSCIGARGAASEILVDGETGFVVEPDDRRALLFAIDRLAGDEALRRSMGARGRERFHRRFTSAHFRARLTGILAEH